MIQRIKRAITALAVSTMLIVPVAVPAMASAQDSIKENLCAGVNLQTTANQSCGASDTETTGRIGSILKTIIDIFSLIVGFISVIMIIVGGLKYITSNGDSGNISSAKNTIIYALVGLAIVALSQVLVKFVLTKVSA